MTLKLIAIMISKFLERSLDEELLKLPLAVAITTM